MKMKVSGRTWLVVIMFGMFGQIAWVVENLYFNLFLFNKIGGTTTDITMMVAASAIVATLTTLFMGALSDRLGHRKMFICFGYIAWGLVTACFALISRENVATFAPAASVVTTAVTLVILLDCIMTFMGSTANDASFNAWVTESVDTTNRGKVEGVLSALPLLAMIIVSGVSGILIESIGYPLFFLSLGGLVSLAGILGLFLIKESYKEPRGNEGYWASIVYGFRPAIIKKHKPLYLSLACTGLFGIATQVFLPFLIIYFEHYLNMSATTYSIVLGLSILISSLIGIILGRLVDKFGRKKFGVAAVLVFSIGLMLIFLLRTTVAVAVAGTIMLCGSLLLTIVINTSVRDHTPTDKVGLFQGIRMIFFVLIPMLMGPAIGNAVIQNSNITYVNEFLETTKIPTPEIFLTASLLSLLVLIPLFFVQKQGEVKEVAGK